MAELLVKFAEPGRLGVAMSGLQPNIIWAYADDCVNLETGRLTSDCLNLIELGRIKKIKIVLVGSRSMLTSIRGAERLPVILIPKPEQNLSVSETSGWLKKRLGSSLGLSATAAQGSVRTARAKHIDPNYLTPVLSPAERKDFFAVMKKVEAADAGLDEHHWVSHQTTTMTEVETSLAQTAAYAIRSEKAGA